MSYGGESWAKKVARLQYWIHAAETVGADRFWRSKFLVLAGPDAGDCRMLVHMFGVPPSQIVAVDRSAEALASAKEACPGPEYVAGDIVAAARERRHRFDHVFVDLCSTIGPGSASVVARAAAQAIRSDGIVGCGYMYGRESAAGRAALDRVRRGLDRQFENIRAMDPVYRKKYLAAFRDISRDDPFGSVEAMEDFVMQANSSDETPAHLRVTAADWITKDAFRTVGFWYAQHFSIAYRSTKDNGGGVPMLYGMGGVKRGATPAWGVDWLVSHPRRALRVAPDAHEGAREACVHFRRMGLSNADIAAGMGVSGARIAAWLAVDTRERKDAVVRT